MKAEFASQIGLYKPQIKFLALLVGIYLVLDYGTFFWIGLAAPGGNTYSAFIEKHLNYIAWLRSGLLYLSSTWASLFQLEHTTTLYSLVLKNHTQVNVGYSCIGIGMYALIIAVGISFPDKTIKSRLAFIISMLLFVYLLNSWRIFLIARFWNDDTHFAFNLNHHDVFNYICYLVIGIAFYAWQRPSAHRSSTYGTV
ncbi:MAG: hypothetical protein ACK4HE_11065 [Chitinophagaceae bacterium]